MADALVLGAARTVWDDVRAASETLKKKEELVIFAVNLMIPGTPVIHHAVSHHVQTLVDLANYRRHHNRFKAQPFLTHSTVNNPEIDHVWEKLREGDSSLLAARVALALGFDRVILAGVPLDGSGHVYDDPARAGDSFLRYRVVWTKFRDELKGRVFSMSGFTRELLGAPAPA